MIRSERLKGKGKRSNPKSSFSKGSPRKDESYEEYSDRRNSGRSNRRDSNKRFSSRSKNKPELEMTKVTCSACGEKCEVPFKPTSSKPVYCSNCYSKDNGKNSNKDLKIINEKLDKIMEALDIN